MQSAVTVVSHISNMSPSVTVISLPLYRVHKTFGSRSLQTHMRSENQIFNDRIKKKFNSDWPPPQRARAAEILLPNVLYLD